MWLQSRRTEPMPEKYGYFIPSSSTSKRIPLQNFYDQRIRDNGERFLVHLCDNKNFKEIWNRYDLRSLYNSSPCRGNSFSRVLYHMSRFPPKLLHVRKGTTVHFERPAVDRLYWNKLLSANSDLKVSLVCNSKGSSVKQVGLKHFVCKVDDDAKPTLDIRFTSKSTRPFLFLGFTFVDSENFLDKRHRTVGNGFHGLTSCSVSISDLRTTRLLFHFDRRGTSFSLALVVDFAITIAQNGYLFNMSQCSEQTPLNTRDIRVIPGERPVLRGMGELQMTRKYESFLIPTALSNMFSDIRRQNVSCFPKNSSNRSTLESEMTSQNYAKKFHLLLHLEELQYITDIKYYKRKATFQKNGCFLSLDVPGLAERRPSILRGDRIFVKKMIDGEECGPGYEGFVHRVEETKIQQKFHEEFHRDFVQKMQFSVNFVFNRNSLRLMHRAAEIITKLVDMRMFFPVKHDNYNTVAPRHNIVMKDRNIERNEAQLFAVTSILQEASPIYLIYGPPGTGKTVTMVESIFQTLDKFTKYHVLVCAPSNSACDLLTERLLKHVDKSSILRLNAPSRSEIPESVLEVSNVNRDKEIYFQCKEELMKFKVIVCTLITAGRLASAEFPDNHFQRIFIDESGQSMESELLVAVSGVLAKDGKLVLAGDSKQLGPIVRSPIAKTKGLQLSLLERLMRTSPYQKQENGQYISKYVTKLTKNYRSHEAIVKLPNEEFYDNDLEVCANDMSRYSLCKWDKLPKWGFPIIFKHIDGKDDREENSPSFFNSREASEVKKYVTSLLQERRYKVRAGEIGVITPYKKQVQKIRQALKNEQIKVGSVEEFQGQERRVIIISTVRSREENLKHDAIFHLGFVADPKRFNVAITRAKSLLIIVGNAKLLCKDKYWRKMYRYCRDNGGYVGPPFNDNDSQSFDIFDKQVELDSMDVESDVEDKNNPEWINDP